MTWTGSEDSYQAFIDEFGLTFPQIDDSGGSVFGRFDVASQPALVVVSPDGSLDQVFGAVNEALLDQIISDAL